MSMITEQVERMRRLADEMEKSTFVHEATHSIAIKVLREAANTIEQLSSKVYASNIERSSAYYNGEWIPVKERLPECEQEVLISAVRKYRCKDETWTDHIITTALYEDGKMLEVNSKWRWEDIDYAGWNEEEDCGIIPEGWWEYRHYNDDEVYNNLVDDHIVAWMPLPLPFKEDKTE